jgi:hypothetical protein
MPGTNVIKAILFSVALLSAASTFAEDRFEIFGDYTYLHFAPTIGGVQNRSFNGGGGGVALNFGGIFQIKADFQGYGGTTFTRIVTTPVIVPGGGRIPAGTYSGSANMFTYLAGPVIRIPIWKVKPFGEVLFGGSNTNGYTNLEKSIIAGGGTVTLSPTQHPFTMAAGGGLDISISHSVSIRPFEADYVLTRYTNPLTSTNNQNNYRYVGGVVFKF